MERIKRFLSGKSIVMNKYYCPYCSPKYQIILKSHNGLMICGHCGDESVKIPTIRTAQIVGLISALAFMSPLFLMFFSLIEEHKPLNHKNNVTKL